MVNATEMAKTFGKSPSHWLRNSQSEEFIKELAELRNCNSSDLVRVTYGDNGGTWMHEDVAMEFARWLSPKFAIWCNDRIKELLTTGVSALPDFNNPAAAARAWAEQNNIQVFTSPQFGEIRTTVIDGEPWFVGKDIAERLGYSNPQKAIRDHVDEEDRTVNESFTVNGTMATLINESGLYSLVLSSKLESAKAFKPLG